MTVELCGYDMHIQVDLTEPEEIEEAIEALQEAKSAQVFTFSGESADCDTCGSDWPEGEVVVVGRKATIRTQYGCFGGYQGSDVEEIRDELNHIRGFMTGPFDEALRALPTN